jgi:hypothetical protein
VCPCPRKLQFLSVNPIEKKPIRIDVCVSPPCPLPFKRVVPVSLRQRLAINQYLEDATQLAHIFAALFRPFHVPFKGP